MGFPPLLIEHTIENTGVETRIQSCESVYSGHSAVQDLQFGFANEPRVDLTVREPVFRAGFCIDDISVDSLEFVWHCAYYSDIQSLDRRPGWVPPIWASVIS